MARQLTPCEATAPGSFARLRLADRILAGAGARVPAPAVAGPGPALTGTGTEALRELKAQLAVGDSALALARRDFNHAVTRGNRALAEFPTTWLGAVFGFGPAGSL